MLPHHKGKNASKLNEHEVKGAFGNLITSNSTAKNLKKQPPEKIFTSEINFKLTFRRCIEKWITYKQKWKCIHTNTLQTLKFTTRFYMK